MKTIPRFLLRIFLVICGMFSEVQSQTITQLYERLEMNLKPEERALTLARLGMVYTDRSLDSSYYYANQALELARNIKDREGEARAMSVLAFYFMEKGKNYLAYQYANDALTIFQRLALSEQVTEMNMNIGVLLLKEGKTKQGIEQIEAAYQQSLKLDRDSIRSLIILNMIMPQAAHMSPTELGQYLTEADRIAEKYQDERMKLILKHAKTSLFYQSGAPIDLARREMKQLKEKLRERGYRYMEAITLMDLAHTFSGQSADSVRNYIQSALDLADSLGYDQLKYVILNHAHQIWQNLPSPPEDANLYSAEIMEINRIRALENEMDGLGFLELSIREKDLQMQQAHLEMRQKWAAILGLTGVLAILIAIWAFRQYSMKRRLLQNLERASKELEKKNVQLEANDQFNTRLIAVLSHDLRQPFSSILMMSNDLLSELDPKDQEVVFQDIQHSARLSLQVLDGLLYWMKLQTVGLAENPVPISLHESVQEALDFYAFDLERSELSIEWKIDEKLVVNVQPEMLLFVHRNLISNAIKYSPQGGVLRFEAYNNTQNGRLRIQISDEGPGIPKKVLKTLFIKSSSLDTDQGKPTQGGAGLALIICKEMMTQMNGDIWAENKVDGSGAIFSYELPAAKQEPISFQKVDESR